MHLPTDVTLASASRKWLVAAGPSSNKIYAKKINGLTEITEDDLCFSVPTGTPGVEYISMLDDDLLCGIIAGGKFYLVDLARRLSVTLLT